MTSVVGAHLLAAALDVPFVVVAVVIVVAGAADDDAANFFFAFVYLMSTHKIRARNVNEALQKERGENKRKFY